MSADPRSFYTERIPAQWNRDLEALEAAGGDEDAARILADMRAVFATIRAEVEGEGAPFFLNIEAGRMSAAPEPAHPPFLTIRQDRRAFDRLAAEAGDSAMAMLGGLSGLAGQMRLTRTRIENLQAVNGLLRFAVEGEGAWSLLTHFGTGPMPDEPDTSISVDEEAYAGLRSGRLDPQTAFLDGQIRVEGDMQLAMQLALAAISPD